MTWALFGGRLGSVSASPARANSLPGHGYFLGPFRNYFHFVVDVLLMLDTVPPRVRPDRFLVGKRMAFHQQWLDLLGWSGIPLVPLVEQGVRCNQLTVSRTLSGTHGQVPWAMIRGLESHLATPRDGPELVYISRSASRRRRLLNEDACEAVIRALGGVVLRLEELSVPEQLAAVGGAGVIVGAHGAGLTNLLFTRHDSTVIELTYPGQPRVFETLCEATGRRHLTVPADSVVPGRNRDDDTWTVPVGALVETVSSHRAGGR